MAVTEHERHQLLTWFEEHMDEERAATMMELLPPAGSDQLATKGDIAELRAELKIDIAEVRTELAGLRAEVKGDLVTLQRTLGTWIVASQAAVIAAMGVATGVIVALS